MQALWLAKVEDDTIFIITLGVVLVVVKRFWQNLTDGVLLLTPVEAWSVCHM